MNQDNVGRPPPPAVVGPPPRPNASTYLSLLPTSERTRTDTVSLQQEFHAQLNTLKPKPPPRVPVRHRRSAEGIPEQNNSKQPFVRTFSDLTVPKQANFSVHQPSAAEIYSDFSVWRAACPPKIYMAVEFIAKHGLQVEGIFRISGDHNKINKLIENARILPADELYKDLQPNDVYVVADFLLRWFAEAFGSLIPEHIFKLLMQNAADMNEIPRKEVKGLIFSLGPSELSALFAVLQLCQLIMEVAVTKMTPRALATCIAPNLLFNPFETDIQVLRADSAKCNSIMEFLIEEFPHLLQDMNTGKSEKLIAFVREKYGNIVVEVSPVGSGDERGRSTEDDRGKKRIFKRKSRSRSRGKRSELKDGKK